MSGPSPPSVSQERGTSSSQRSRKPTLNILRPCGYSDSECGYCKGERASLVHKTPSTSSRSYGVLVDDMTPEIYEEFMYQGWRRSGIHLYKPCNWESCCPTLTIRLPVARFQPTRSQRKVLKKLNSLLQGPPSSSSSAKKPKSQRTTSSKEAVAAVHKSGIITKVESLTSDALSSCLPEEYFKQQQQSSTPPAVVKYKVRPPAKGQAADMVVISTSICAQIAGRHRGLVERDALAQTLLDQVRPKVQKCFEASGEVSVQSAEVHAPSGQLSVSLQVSHLQTANTNPVSSTDLEMSDAAPPVDKLASWFQTTLQRFPASDRRQLKITTLPAHESILDPEVHKLYALYQHKVHNDPDVFAPPDVDSSSNDDPHLPASLADIDWGNAPADWPPRVQAMLGRYTSTYPASWKRSILSHFYSFYQFLIESPFPIPVIDDDDYNNSHKQMGTFHQHYRIDGVLIAVGVIDILPNGVSSVYLFYHPSFSHNLVALGKLAILKEIEFTQQQVELQYYYLGYYIESCPKMRYKSDYKPSQLLCPTTFQWVDAEQASQRLQSTAGEHHICTLVEDAPPADRDSQAGATEPPVSQMAKNIALDIGAGMTVTMDMLQEEGQRVVRPFIEDFVQEAGSQLSRKCILKLN